MNDVNRVSERGISKENIGEEVYGFFQVKKVKRKKLLFFQLNPLAFTKWGVL